MSGPRLRVAAAAVLLLSASALTAGVTSTAHADPQPPDRRDAAVRALAHHLDVSTGTARARLAAERRASELGARLAAAVGADAAGHYVVADDKNSAHVLAVVNVTSQAAAATVRAGGARAVLVPYSMETLRNTKDALDRIAQNLGPGQVQSWGIDVVRNVVLVTTTAGVTDSATEDFLSAARTHAAVRVTTSSARVTTMADLLGGQQIDFGDYRCSLGFNARDASGNPVMITAGHCAEDYPTFSSDGVEIGTTTGYTFPGPGDYAEVPVTNAFWKPRGAVIAKAGDQVVTGTAPVAVGASICKDGRSTDWTCGTVLSLDNTVNYDSGDGSTETVTGLTATSACAEPGDSGGAVMSGDQAQGLTSGGAGYDDDGNPLTPLVCGQHLGRPDVSFVQPIAGPLEDYGLRLITESAAGGSGGGSGGADRG